MPILHTNNVLHTNNEESALQYLTYIKKDNKILRRQGLNPSCSKPFENIMAPNNFHRQDTSLSQTHHECNIEKLHCLQ